MERLNVEISWGTLWRISFFLLFITVLIIGRQIVLALFLSIAISSGVEFMVAFLTEHKVPRTLAVVTVFLLGAFILAAFIYFVLPFIIADLGLVLSSLGGSPFGEWIRPLTQGDNSLASWIQKISASLLAGKFGSFSTVQGVFNGVALGVTVLMASFYLSLSKNGVERFIQAILPEDVEERAMRLYSRSMQKISLWLRSQIALSLIVGVLVWAALFLLHVRHSLVLGIFAAVFEIVPFVGPILAGALAVLFAFITSPSLALYTLIAFVVIQQFESNVLVPIVTHKAVGLHPVVVIVAFLIGIEAGGFLGALVAVPAAAVFQEIMEDRALRRPPKS
jgi:predicted PurR-regulated permease PerM